MFVHFSTLLTAQNLNIRIAIAITLMLESSSNAFQTKKSVYMTKTAYIQSGTPQELHLPVCSRRRVSRAYHVTWLGSHQHRQLHRSIVALAVRRAPNHGDRLGYVLAPVMPWTLGSSNAWQSVHKGTAMRSHLA